MDERELQVLQIFHQIILLFYHLVMYKFQLKQLYLMLSDVLDQDHEQHNKVFLLFVELYQNQLFG
jgi:hypothetical protein